jgi:Arc-like DNA binding domain
MKKRKRAPGGGRKPSGDFGELTVKFSVRMPASMREELKRSAKKRGRSDGQELLARLQGSFNRDRKLNRDQNLQALCFLIAEAAEAIDRRMWQSNPFFFEAFRLTVAKLLDGLRPPGKIRFPMDKQPREKQGLLYRVHKTPKAYSEFVLAGIVAALNRPTPPREEYEEYAEIARRWPEITARWDAQFFGMTDAKRHLATGGKS